MDCMTAMSILRVGVVPVVAGFAVAIGVKKCLEFFLPLFHEIDAMD